MLGLFLTHVQTYFGRDEPKEDVGVGGIVSGDVARVTFKGQNPNAIEWVRHVGQLLASFIVSAHQVGGKKERAYTEEGK